jgi:hypothetical protein
MLGRNAASAGDANDRPGLARAARGTARTSVAWVTDGERAVLSVGVLEPQYRSPPETAVGLYRFLNNEDPSFGQILEPHVVISAARCGGQVAVDAVDVDPEAPGRSGERNARELTSPTSAPGMLRPIGAQRNAVNQYLRHNYNASPAKIVFGHYGGARNPSLYALVQKVYGRRGISFCKARAIRERRTPGDLVKVNIGYNTVPVDE